MTLKKNFGWFTFVAIALIALSGGCGHQLRQNNNSSQDKASASNPEDSQSLQQRSQADNHSYTAGNFILELDGHNVGYLKSVDGGEIKAGAEKDVETDVINEPTGPDHVKRRHIGGVKYDDFMISFGLGTSPPLEEWIKDSWNHKYSRKNGAIVQADFNYKEKFRREFYDALITEVGFPVLDGLDKNSGYIKVKFLLAYTLSTKSDDGSDQNYWPPPVDAKPEYMIVKFATEYTRNKKATEPSAADISLPMRPWSPSNYEFTIDDMDTSDVNKIDAFAVRNTAITDNIGAARDYQKEPGKLEFPNLIFYTSEPFVKAWIDWHRGFEVKGGCREQNCRNGAIKFFNPDRSETLLTVTLARCYPIAVCPMQTGEADVIKRWKIEVYCEEMALR